MSRRPGRGGWVTCPRCGRRVFRLERIDKAPFGGPAMLEMVRLADGVRELESAPGRVLACPRGHRVEDARL